MRDRVRITTSSRPGAQGAADDAITIDEDRGFAVLADGSRERSRRGVAARAAAAAATERIRARGPGEEAAAMLNSAFAAADEAVRRAMEGLPASRSGGVMLIVAVV